MRLGYLEAFAGISGDMLLGALIDAGAPPELLHRTLAGLGLGATLAIEKVDRSGLHATFVKVLVDGEPAEKKSAPSSHGRSLSAILDLLDRAALPKPVGNLAARTFELLGASEAKIHHVPIEAIHFHEVGAIDSIVDVVLVATAVHALEIDSWHCSRLNVGGGTVECAHGRYPVPAPATADLLLGAPTYSSGPEMEMVTPTGAALVRALGCAFGPRPSLRVEKIGYGAGSRNPPRFANALRLSWGEAAEEAASGETVTVLETALDDLNPQVVAYVAEQALKLGALDVMCTPVQMKKGRPGVLLTILSGAAQVSRLQDLLLRETSTLGLRMREERRVVLQREHVTIATPWGPVRIKRGLREGAECNAAPEFEDCRKIAEAHSVPLKQVLETALQAYRREIPREPVE